MLSSLKKSARREKIFPSIYNLAANLYNAKQAILSPERLSFTVAPIEYFN
jgi:hypothetical protein